MTGGRDGCVRVWDQRVSDPVMIVEPREEDVRPARFCSPSVTKMSYALYDIFLTLVNLMRVLCLGRALILETWCMRRSSV